jgi:hypothetical protein
MDLNINVSNKNGCTPAHFLAISCDVPTDIIPFVKQGASLTIPNKNGVIPLALLYAKAIQKTPALMTSSDLKLVLTQSMYIGFGFYCLYLVRQFPGIHLAVQTEEEIEALIGFLQKICIPLTGVAISYFAKQKIVSNLPTTQKIHPLIRSNVSITGRFRLALIAGVTDLFSPNSSKALMVLNEFSTNYAVAKNSYCGLKRCVQQLSVRPFAALGAAGVHLLNFGLELGSSVPSYIAIFSQPAGSIPAEPLPVENCAVPDRLSGLSNLELATHKDLNPHGCLNHAKIILAGSKSTFDEAEFQDKKCAYVNSLYRKMSLILHPDKNHGSVQAFDRLTQAKETFERIGACEDPGFFGFFKKFFSEPAPMTIQGFLKP